MKQSRRKHGRAFKAKVALAALRGDQTIFGACQPWLLRHDNECQSGFRPRTAEARRRGRLMRLCQCIHGGGSSTTSPGRTSRENLYDHLQPCSRPRSKNTGIYHVYWALSKLPCLLGKYGPPLPRYLLEGHANASLSQGLLHGQIHFPFVVADYPRRGLLA